MWRIKTITGTIIESSRFTNKPMHWHELPVCNERRELWLATSHEDEHGFIIHTKLMPARKTHCVTLVLGLYNATTGASANYIREDSPFLIKGLDLVVLAVWCLAGFFCATTAWLGTAQIFVGVMAYLLLAIACRAVHLKRLRNLVDEAVNEPRLMRVVRPLHKVQ